jgi:hypothetical protein
MLELILKILGTTDKVVALGAVTVPVLEKIVGLLEPAAKDDGTSTTADEIEAYRAKVRTELQDAIGVWQKIEDTAKAEVGGE